MVSVEAPVVIERTRVIAPIWRRVASAFLDGLFLLLALWPLSSIVSGLIFALVIDKTLNIETAFAILFGFYAAIVVVLGGCLLAIQITGTSPGLFLMSIRIVGADDRRPGWGPGFGRLIIPALFSFAAGVASAIVTFTVAEPRIPGLIVQGIIVWFPYAWALWERENRKLHDLAAGTWVIRDGEDREPPRPIEDPAPSTM